MASVRSIKHTKGGFTIVEMIVAIGLFVTVFTITVGALLVVVDVYRKSQTMRIAMDNLNLAIEDIGRNMRQGVRFNCGAEAPIGDIHYCDTGTSTFAFEPHNGDVSDANDQVVYRLNANRIEKSIDSGASWETITAPALTITRLMFYYVENTHIVDQQPNVLIVVEGVVGSGREDETSFSIQTSVTQRAPEPT